MGRYEQVEEMSVWNYTVCISYVFQEHVKILHTQNLTKSAKMGEAKNTNRNKLVYCT